jgi:hypothetical protein
VHRLTHNTVLEGAEAGGVRPLSYAEMDNLPIERFAEPGGLAVSLARPVSETTCSRHRWQRLIPSGRLPRRRPASRPFPAFGHYSQWHRLAVCAPCMLSATTALPSMSATIVPWWSFTKTVIAAICLRNSYVRSTKPNPREPLRWCELLQFMGPMLHSTTHHWQAVHLDIHQ